LSKIGQKVVKQLSISCQKVVKKLLQILSHLVKTKKVNRPEKKNKNGNGNGNGNGNKKKKKKIFPRPGADYVAPGKRELRHCMP
jgi:hypothetical protein